MAWVVKGEEAGIIDYFYDDLSKRHKAVIGAFAVTFGDLLYRFKDEYEAEMVARNVYYDDEEMYAYEVDDDENTKRD
ncbi:hypothetical protein [Lacticaseibacillus rhamnosus]|uniref:hypothetical protein n=1 Tax=Lacticaseibacillus rhamnosus TaxID=47715 RepID=UPI000629E874|nr:hypothetical protein [Lacticaseibacillus rhamnosus]KKW88322.1 hypothetical protein XA20_04605 [Lacticaseibacillus rhamnosus]MCZ2733630.1 hypothetical protein [Lacticaseibacillus rhamnosus]MCZ2736312.1 hypothetical protein [Lacticaseibacillus rhamnosus]MCZ2742614.1 hypothetical protein [Lacticaseibacillus rhamnosus]MCZ2745357.1 hypothetical protein [Lacticaseibacillus rhamnosus]